MTGFRVNEEQALDYMAQQDFATANRGGHTIYAVMCHHELADGVGSHGGFIVPNGRIAIDESQRLNDTVPEDHACTYVPVALALLPATVRQVAEDRREVPPDDRE